LEKVPLLVTVVALFAPPFTLQPPALEGKTTVRLVPDRVKLLALEPHEQLTVLEPDVPLIDAFVTYPEPAAEQVVSP
jgi:hypothetical protein